MANENKLGKNKKFRVKFQLDRMVVIIRYAFALSRLVHMQLETKVTWTGLFVVQVLLLS